MKIEQIDLKAYGHFTNQRLALGGAANFHIICGPNEAGKTTLWRAINGALFGIPEQTRDGHLHTNSKLRVGLALSSQAGDRLAVMRRKGRVNTLLKYDPATGDELSDAVSDDRLREWLGGLSQGLFLAMFSLDHDALVLGGEALAQGKGDAGESLFEAGAGLSSIRTLRTKLEREAESLFKPRASTSVIYKSLSEYDDTRKQAKEAIIRPADWTSAKSVMDTASKAYEAAKAEQTQLQREARRLERLAAILPDVAALGLAQQRLAELVGVPELPPSAPAERIAAVTKRNNAIDAERSANGRLAQHQGELASVQYNEAILVDAEPIEAIHHATTTYRDATVQLATADAVIESAQGTFDAALKQISSEASDIEVMQWIPDSTRLARIRALITPGATLKAKHDADLKTLGEKKLAVAQLNAELLGLGQDSGATGLAAYLDSIADHGDPEARALQLEGEVSTAEAKLDTEAGALQMTSADAVAATTAPLDAVVQQYKTDDDELRRQARSIGEAKDKLEDDLASLQADIKGLEVRGDVPTKEAVTGERTRRNELWLSIRRHFMPLQGEPAATEPPPPAERYEHAVTSADDAADGMFANAERATRYAELRVRESQMQSALDLAKGRAETVVTNQAALHKRWADLLTSHGLPSITIAEAATWITKREAFLQKVDANQTKRQEAQQNRALAHEIRARIAKLFQQLRMDPPPSAEHLSEILARARIISKQHADQLTQRALKKAAQATAEIAKTHAEGDEATSRNKLDDWRLQWDAAMQAIRLAGDVSPEEATARIEQFADLQEAHDELEDAKGDRRKAQIQIDDFANRLTETWQSVHGGAIPVDGRSHELLAGDLYQELTEARALQQQKATLTQQVADDQLAVGDARGLAEDAAKTIDKLLLQANCITLESLELIEGQSAQRSASAAEVREIETRLVKSAGLPLADALSQAQGQDPDAVAESLDHNLQENEENAALLQKQHEDYLAARQVFEKMDGSASAADAQQKLAQHSARIAELGADYAASRIASAVLAQVIDTYQKRNQGPLIEQASKRYAAITGGRYSSVVIDYDEDKQILKAVRADGERLSMEQLSTGRRDQLFLALRLAAIEGHLDKREPLPIIIDDILIQFDDAAAAATFKVLADLSNRTQVLFLTHHEHLLEVATASIGSGAYQPHLI
jgi:exonuclease SbcC